MVTNWASWKLRFFAKLWLFGRCGSAKSVLGAASAQPPSDNSAPAEVSAVFDSGRAWQIASLVNELRHFCIMLTDFCLQPTAY